jgi:hypothetical protein
MIDTAQHKVASRRLFLAMVLIVCVLLMNISIAAHFHHHPSNQPQNGHCGICLHLGHLIAFCVIVVGLLSSGTRREFIRVWKLSAVRQGIIWLPFVRPPPVL